MALVQKLGIGGWPACETGFADYVRYACLSQLGSGVLYSACRLEAGSMCCSHVMLRAANTLRYAACFAHSMLTGFTEALPLMRKVEGMFDQHIVRYAVLSSFSTNQQLPCNCVVPCLYVLHASVDTLGILQSH